MQETQLLLVVENKPTIDNSPPWEKARVITHIDCAHAVIEGDTIVSDMRGVTVRALKEAFDEADTRILTALEPGQWIEMTGHNGGPLGDIFFPATIKVRDDLKKVASGLPQADDLYNDVIDTMLGDFIPAPLRFPAHG